MKHDIYALIPARSGSKGIPDKNIKLLDGIPLLVWSIKIANQCLGIKKAIVSTDSSRYAEIAKTYGATPLLRPPEISTDSSGDIDYIKHFMDNYNADYIVLLRPTTPLRSPELIEKAIDLFLSDKYATSLRSAHELREPVEKMMRLNGNYLVGIFPSVDRFEYYNLPRQEFPPSYHPNGYIDIIKTSFVKSSNSLYGSRILALLTPFVVEIDRIEDFEYLEYIIKKGGNI
jgi:CMP-N-acetylneuraminic acid synthetase